MVERLDGLKSSEPNSLRSGAVRTFKDLLVWQKAMQLSVEVYRLTKTYPGHERYGLTAETRKTSRSVPYNIAEGHQRGSTAEYIRFLGIAAGSAAELETQLLLADRLGYLKETQQKHRLPCMLKW
jgi:four helix bundle protein